VLLQGLPRSRVVDPVILGQVVWSSGIAEVRDDATLGASYEVRG
jgi:hypothetical protein